MSISGYAMSDAVIGATLYFTPSYDLHYEIRDTFTVTSSKTVTTAAHMDAEINRFPGHPVFFASGFQDTPVPADTTVMQDAPSLRAVIGNPAGSLLAGTRYDFHFEEGIAAAPSGVVQGARATGDLALTFSLRGDLKGDRSVGFDDLLTVAQHYGQSGATYAAGDIDLRFFRPLSGVSTALM